ncbi:replication initiation protein [Microvirga sp. STR05]|uniref:Replication initiation protein n=1 Tax=Hymenobacter duratus TaxID=2771356 RepID=A0ABR8JN28_9BACT|nr:replication initiation protein [Hymenobacter duratus]MBD2717290.1 replication initiation protein [Hymenobacter duratus]MBR7952210.1 replication initiation protein [Microvirga sp. STR05]
MVPVIAPPLYPRAYQANALVRAPLKLTHVEARIFALALGCIHQDQTELPGISIPLNRVMTQKKGGSVYETIRDACKSLMSKVVSIESQTGNKKRFTAYSIISYIDLNEGTGYLTGNFAPEIKPFLLQLAEQYTHVELETLLTLKSAHAHRLYWLLKSWDDVGIWEVEFDTLRKQVLGDDNDVTYTLFYDFKRYVLEPALRELYSLGWVVTYEPVKEGKKVKRVRFAIPKPLAQLNPEDGATTASVGKTTSRSRPLEKQMSLSLQAELPTLQQRIVTRLQKLKMTAAQIQHVLDYMGDDEVKIARLMKVSHPLLRDFEAGNKVFDNLGGAATNLLKTEFPGLYPALK